MNLWNLGDEQARHPGLPGTEEFDGQWKDVTARGLEVMGLREI